MDNDKTVQTNFNQLLFGGLSQFVLFTTYFYLLYTEGSKFIFLLPAILLQIIVYLFVMANPVRTLVFFIILLPITAIGIIPTFYREIFIFFIPIFSIFFIGITSFINKEKVNLSKIPITQYLILLMLALIISFINACLRGWFSFQLLRHSYALVQALLILSIISVVLKEKNVLFNTVYFLLLSCGIASLVFLTLGFLQGGFTFRKIFVPFAEFSLNEIAIFFGPYISLGIALIWVVRSFVKKLFIILSVILMSIALIITQSRGGWVAVFIVITYIFIKKKFYKGIVIIGIFITILLSFELLKNILTVRLIQTSGSDISLLQRFLLWQAAVRVIKENFLFGVGMNNFRLIKFHFGIPQWMDLSKVHHAHNIYLDILANLGILGFLGFFGLIRKTIVKLNTVKREFDGELVQLSMALKSALLTFLIHGIIDCGLFRNVTFFSIMVLIGLSWATIKIVSINLKNNNEKNSLDNTPIRQ